MSLNIPLSVRLSTPKGDMHVTQGLSGLQFRTTAPGGFASASFTLNRPLALQPNEIAEFGKVYIYDRRDGTTVWEGRLEDSGRGSGDSGQTWQITATGPAVYAQDRTQSWIYADRNIQSGWQVGGQSIPSVDVTITDSGIKMGVSNGTTHNAGYAGMAVYHSIAYTGQQVARCAADWTAGFLSSNNEVWLGSSLGTGGTIPHDSNQIITPGSGTLTCELGGTNPITAGNDTIRLRFVRITGNLTPTDDNIWVSFVPRIRGILTDINGNDVTSGYGADTVTPLEIITDILGRLLLDVYDGPNADIAVTPLDLDQFAYPDGATAQKILEDLMLLAPTYYWAAWESGTNGLHRFEWREWPTTVRYDASTVDGFDGASATGELYNSVTVRWRDGSGVGRSIQVTNPVATLTAAGLTRQAYVDLSDEVGSPLNATNVGITFLEEHQMPINEGTLTVSRPIIDMDQGRQVQPWEIKPGHLIRVRDVLPRIDALNPAGRDSVSIFKITAVEYNAGTGSATIELDSTPFTLPRAVGKLIRSKIVRKR